MNELQNVLYRMKQQINEMKKNLYQCKPCLLVVSRAQGGQYRMRRR